MTQLILVDLYAAQAATGIKAATLRQWRHRGHLTRHGYDRYGRALVDLAEVNKRRAKAAA
ncbi:hypothetical protein [Streptomyces sp. SPB78]|uniref:hypothetical protein n=1 Tax=Streptomyces sp. (strain SPB78) TaxID=591157 RepID=UPI0002FDA227|nr:hypothetical protein [Streptomyces sp. SPB78]